MWLIGHPICSLIPTQPPDFIGGSCNCGRDLPIGRNVGHDPFHIEHGRLSSLGAAILTAVRYSPSPRSENVVVSASALRFLVGNDFLTPMTSTWDIATASSPTLRMTRVSKDASNPDPDDRDRRRANCAEAQALINREIHASACAGISAVPP